ncbi:MAG: DNA double-strand break repair nuclease NurA [Armatimonas sp.]
MPYKGETAGKSGHSSFVQNPDIQDFIAECDYIKEPTDDEATSIGSSFIDTPVKQNIINPSYIIASDASKSDQSISDKLPSTQIGYVKLSQVLIDMNSYGEIIDPKSRFVDPFKVAEIHRNASAISFALPGSNVRYKNATNVKNGFRRAVYDQLSTNRSKNTNTKLVLSEILFDINNNKLSFGSDSESWCPSCNFRFSYYLTKQQPTTTCPKCHETIFSTDWLRLHEDISDFGNNTSAITRMMNAVEHLLLISTIKQVLEINPIALSKISFIIDGPLAIFGQPAKLSFRIQEFLHDTNEILLKKGLDPILLMGLQKTGEIMDHANILSKFIPDSKLRIIDDKYRYKYIKGNDSPAASFGHETYYGQDFLFKTKNSQIFCFGIPYPFKKRFNTTEFSELKSDMNNYGDMVSRACQLIEHFEFDLYRSAIVPIALAHRHASISLVPGGKVLDVITRTGLARSSGSAS